MYILFAVNFCQLLVNRFRSKASKCAQVIVKFKPCFLLMSSTPLFIGSCLCIWFQVLFFRFFLYPHEHSTFFSLLVPKQKFVLHCLQPPCKSLTRIGSSMWAKPTKVRHLLFRLINPLQCDSVMGGESLCKGNSL